MSVLIGYVAKRYTPPPAYIERPGLREVASVSDCLVERPKGWLDLWRHNDWYLYDSPELAREIARECRAYDWPVTALFLYPVQFEPDEEVPLDVQSTAAPPGDLFQRLGWDVVSRHLTEMFECSPLSCNNLAKDVAVNDACLLDSEAEAIAVARRCAVEQPEPGSYFVIEVWREQNRIED
jgi:hypothetical protein